ncbi:hypothetical protein GURKE_01940 [Brevundimonas phage vB_BpoS-Gurke]|uniref:Uncharacterized protein n=1 Tax=Brevundimonas phage vB_BpoS-Gurke TaxID=2948599 RepID=A0A9E7N3J8_9CAUD|nr:hypothetical protein GURKE_01940 [Brevundimonas phage vB_BpoS-Gurke]
MFTYTVELNCCAEFPLDMLRYDDAGAATAEDQALIELMQDISSDRSQLARDVAITLTTTSRHAPHVKRWESFGVKVIESDNPLTAVELALARIPQMSRLDYLTIERRAEDAYDITYKPSGRSPFKEGRVARLRGYASGVWRIIWEGDSLGMILGDGLTDQDFRSPQEAYAQFIGQALK